MLLKFAQQPPCRKAAWPLQRLTCAALLGTLITPAVADDDDEPLMETLVVTGTRLASDRLLDREVLNRETIEALGSVSTSGALRAMPHLYLFENGGPGGVTYAGIRGGDPNFALVLVDGIVVNDPTNSRGGGFDYNQINPSSLERVELYRGGVSAIYGGEALSGVLQLSTRAQDASQIFASAGNEGQAEIGLSTGGALGESGSIFIQASQNQLERSSIQSYENQQLMISAKSETEKLLISALGSLSLQDASSYPEDSGGELSVLQAAEIRDSEQYIAGLRAQYALSPSTQFTFMASRTLHEELADNPGIAPGELSGVPPNRIFSSYGQDFIDANAAWSNGDDWTLVVGGSFRSAEGKNTGIVDLGFPLPTDYRLKQETASLYTEAVLRASWGTASIGLRGDSSEGFDRETSLRLGISREVSERLQLRANYGEGYKLPSFFALGNPLVGNPRLEPERSVTRSLDALFQLNDYTSFSTSLFHNDYTNLVDFDPEAFTNFNRGTFDASGAELGLNWSPSEAITSQLDVTYLRAESAEEESPLRRRPRWLLNASVYLDRGPTSAFLAIRHRSSFFDSSVLTGLQTLKGYTTLDFGASWQLSPNLRLSVNVDNAFDSTLEDSIGFVDTGRLARLGFVVTL